MAQRTGKDGKSQQQRAKLRCCASCEWVFLKSKDTGTMCPKCEFGSYGARFVYGHQCYGYLLTQEPWLKKKLESRRMKLMDEIRRSHASLPDHLIVKQYPHLPSFNHHDDS